MRRAARLVALCMVLLLSACAGTRFTWDQARQIRVGMTEKEVTELMGDANNVVAQGSRQKWVWVWVNLYSSTRTVTTIFENGKVVEVPTIPESWK